MTVLDLLSTSSSTGFAEACAQVLDFLQEHVPLGFWAVSRYDGERQVFLEVRDSVYGLTSGASLPWRGTSCSLMVQGSPRMAPDAQGVPEYKAAAEALGFQLGTYVGVPLLDAQGKVFGTLCGAARNSSDASLAAHQPLLELLASLLSSILEADRHRLHQEREIERALALAETDQLTGLLNRRGWERFLDLAGERWRRFGDPGAVLVLDVDGLKEVNDTQGHAAGDLLIQGVAEVLSRATRSLDAVGRLGGDEFGVVLQGVTLAQADLVRQRIEHLLSIASLTASVGVATYTQGEGFEGCHAAADAAMYVQKRQLKGAC